MKFNITLELNEKELKDLQDVCIYDLDMNEDEMEDPIVMIREFFCMGQTELVDVRDKVTITLVEEE